MKKTILCILCIPLIVLTACFYEIPAPVPCDVVLYNHLDELPPAFAQSSAAATDPGLLPPEYVQYAAVPESSMIKQVDENTVLIFEQVAGGAGIGREVSAYVRKDVLNIDVRKFRTVDDDWTGAIFYAVITIPDGVTVETIDTRYRTIFKTVFPNKTPK